jgi:quercetin dioxygenase-like cupin family protein
MLDKGYYQGKSEDEIALELAAQGTRPERVQDAPGSRYDGHKNTDDIVMAFVQGSAEVRVGDTVFRCEPGDRLTIDGDTEHSAQVGSDGVVYLMSLVARAPGLPGASLTA